MPNHCESGTRAEEAEFDDLFVKDPEELKTDPHTCFFENQHYAHGSSWTPNYDKCFSCSCRVRTKECVAFERGSGETGLLAAAVSSPYVTNKKPRRLSAEADGDL